MRGREVTFEQKIYTPVPLYLILNNMEIWGTMDVQLYRKIIK
jgi:hypothetical protein